MIRILLRFGLAGFLALTLAREFGAPQTFDVIFFFVIFFYIFNIALLMMIHEIFPERRMVSR